VRQRVRAEGREVEVVGGGCLAPHGQRRDALQLLLYLGHTAQSVGPQWILNGIRSSSWLERQFRMLHQKDVSRQCLEHACRPYVPCPKADEAEIPCPVSVSDVWSQLSRTFRDSRVSISAAVGLGTCAGACCNVATSDVIEHGS